MSKLPLRFRPEAQEEVLEAYDWYAERSVKAARAFEDELLRAGELIQDAPERWASYSAGTRRYLLRRFPFALVFRVAASHIEIVAVAHLRRKPGYWKQRL